MAAFSKMGTNISLYSIVFGRSIFNDAVLLLAQTAKIDDALYRPFSEIYLFLEELYRTNMYSKVLKGNFPQPKMFIRKKDRLGVVARLK